MPLVILFFTDLSFIERLEMLSVNTAFYKSLLCVVFVFVINFDVP